MDYFNHQFGILIVLISKDMKKILNFADWSKII